MSSDPPPAASNIQRLASAFARMFGADSQSSSPALAIAAPDDDLELHRISPRSIVEGRLFVGSPGDGFFTAEALVAGLREVSPEEIPNLVTELNTLYQRDSAPYVIEHSPAGYRLQLHEAHHRLRDKFHGRVRETTLTPTLLEVLSVVAYRQPITLADIDTLRNARSSYSVNQLVRRGLVRLDRTPTGVEYGTTPKFLQLFRLQSASQLPVVAEVTE